MMELFKLKVLDLDKETVKIGDVYDFTFNVKYNTLGLAEAVLTWLINRSDKFEVENSAMNDQGQLVMRCKCIKNPLPFLVVFAVIVGGSGALLYMFGLTLNRVDKVITQPAGSALGFAAAAAVIFVLLKLR